MHTTEQIEARALELHQTRNANAARHGWITQGYDGAERDFCMAAARGQLETEAYEAAKAEAEIARWSRVSTPALKAMISDLERRRAAYNYFLFTSSDAADRDRAELYRMTLEYTRRLRVKIAADNAATDAAIAESAVRLADMRTPVRAADLSPAVEAV